jgi:hypothetical protein
MSSSKSERDLDCVVPSDQIESDLTSFGTSHVENGYFFDLQGQIWKQ